MNTHRPVTLANTEQVEFRSKVNGRQYSISVGLPLALTPEGGCPVLYVLDGYWYFASAVEAARANARDVVVVGISYPDDESYVESVLGRHQPLPVWLEKEHGFRAAVGLERMYDLSLPASDDTLAGDFLPGHALTSTDVGGLDDFLDTLETQVKPRVAAMACIDSSNEAIFGHSLGGLAVLRALFAEPNGYRTFVASSPSIWWNRSAILSGEADFAEAIRNGKARPRVLISMGSEEDTPDPTSPVPSDVHFDCYTALVQKYRMIENARELTQRLKALNGSGGAEVEDYVLFPKQGHGISPWPALGRAIAFAFPP